MISTNCIYNYDGQVQMTPREHATFEVTTRVDYRTKTKSLDISQHSRTFIRNVRYRVKYSYDKCNFPDHFSMIVCQKYCVPRIWYNTYVIRFETTNHISTIRLFRAERCRREKLLETGDGCWFRHVLIIGQFGRGSARKRWTVDRQVQRMFGSTLCRTYVSESRGEVFDR